MEVPFALPDLGDEEIQEVISVIQSGWLTSASRCRRFEEDFSLYVGAKHALAVNSATAALHLGIEAIGIQEDAAVLAPTLTFTASAEVIRYLGAEPVFADCDKDTFCVTADTISTAYHNYQKQGFSKKIRAIIPVHFGGHACEMSDIMAFAEKYHLNVIEDAAHALPTRYTVKQGIGEQQAPRGKLIGTFGDVTCFSFYANKTITTGEGGMLCTDHDNIANRVKVMRLHGISRDVWDRFKTGHSWEYDIVAPGYKYNMPDLNAALGIHQLKKAETFRNRRQRIADIYYDELKDIPGLILPKIKCLKQDHSWYLFMVLIDPDQSKTGINRDDLIRLLAERNIGTSVHYKPLHRMTYYRQRYDLTPDMFPNAEWVFQRCASLPIYSKMNDLQINYVVDAIKEIMAC